MERVDVATLATRVLLALVQNVTVDEDQRPSFDLAHGVELVFFDYLIVILFAVRRTDGLRLQSLGKSCALVVAEASSFSSRLTRPHKTLLDCRPPVAPRRKAQTAIILGRVLERIPVAHSTRRVSVQKCTVLVRRHSPTNLGLFANHHGLQDTWVAEGQRLGNGSIAGRERDGAEARRELVQVVANFVDGPMLGLGQVARLIEGVFAMSAGHHV